MLLDADFSADSKFRIYLVRKLNFDVEKHVLKFSKIVFRTLFATKLPRIELKIIPFDVELNSLQDCLFGFAICGY